MSKPVKLKRCPYCGQEAHTIEISPSTYTVMCDDDVDEFRCGGRGGVAASAQKAAEKWNRRAKP